MTYSTPREFSNSRNSLKSLLRRMVQELKQQLQRLQMHKTQQRNAVLIFVAPRAHKFAVVGDKAIHEKCGDEFWQRIVEGMRTHFQNEKFSHALVEAIQEIGKMLAAHFPKTSANADELPDQIAEG